MIKNKNNRNNKLFIKKYFLTEIWDETIRLKWSVRNLRPTNPSEMIHGRFSTEIPSEMIHRKFPTEFRSKRIHGKFPTKNISLKLSTKTVCLTFPTDSFRWKFLTDFFLRPFFRRIFVHHKFVGNFQLAMDFWCYRQIFTVKKIILFLLFIISLYHIKYFIHVFPLKK